MLDTRFLEIASTIGAKLCRDALWAGDYCNWYGPATKIVGKQWQTVRVTYGPDLYDGTSGIAFFLASLYSVVDEPIYHRVARGAMYQALDHCSHLTKRVGFYNGGTGIAYAAIQLATMLNDADLAAAGWRLIEGIACPPPIDGELDVLTGYAGAIPALLELYHSNHQQYLLDTAYAFGEMLLNSAISNDGTLSWPSPVTPTVTPRRTTRGTTRQIAHGALPHNLLGYSHGAAGIGLALLELAQATNVDKFYDAATRAFAYERAWFLEEWQNWPDLRTSNHPEPAEPSNMIAWCHGAPGIGLSRLRAHALTQDATYLQEANTAVDTTAKHLRATMTSDSYNFSLCHGLAGNAELLLHAAHYLARPELLDLAREVGDFGITQHHQARLAWPGGTRGAVENPGFMLGLAGTGNFFLRLAAPTVPSLCLLEPCFTTTEAGER